VPQGRAVRLEVVHQAPGIQTRLVVAHEQVLYPGTLTPWSEQTRYVVFPEAPGAHVITVQWRAPDDRRGRCELGFTVSEPWLRRAARQLQRLLPARLVAADGRVPRHRDLGEQALVSWLGRHVAPGSVAYDIGAHHGVYSVLLARAAGPSGHVYCLEPSPLCVQALIRTLLRARARTATILPVAAASACCEVGLLLSYGNSYLGVTSESPFFTWKLGQPITVQGWDLDTLISELDLRPPDLIKIDIEGAEVRAVAGMRQTLEQARPRLVIELHGPDVAADTLAQLTELGYRFRLPEPGSVLFSTSEILRDAPDVLQIIALPEPR
jgi:FkbM family methyltransferase